MGCLPIPRPTARDLASRLGIDQMAAPQSIYRALASLRYFARGYRYATHLPLARTPPPTQRTRHASGLEQYAEAHTAGPGLFKWRHYFDIYDRHLNRFRGVDVHLLEIGVAGGGSLGMWRDYLGPSARLCGIDIDPECRRFATDGVEIVIGDQADPAFWKHFTETHDRIDVVIDDGGHFPHQQIATLENLLPYITPGGVYVCEDIHGPFQPFHAYLDALARSLNSVGFAEEVNPASELQRQVASIHRYPIVTVIEKAEWSPERFECEHLGSEWPGGWVDTHAAITRAPDKPN